MEIQQKVNPASQPTPKILTKEREAIHSYIEGVKDTTAQFFLYSGNNLGDMIHLIPFLQYVAFVLNHYEHIMLTKEQSSDPKYSEEYYTIDNINLKRFL